MSQHTNGNCWEKQSGARLEVIPRSLMLSQVHSTGARLEQTASVPSETTNKGLRG